jgi:hypothetical protein
MHIPKTAGTSVAAAVRACTGSRTPVYGIDRSLFGNFADFDSMDSSLRQLIYLNAHLPTLDADCLIGHMSVSTLTAKRPGTQLVTILREPRSRLLSLWLFWRSNTDDQLRPWGAWAEYVRRSRGPLAGFLSDRGVACHTDNMAVRMLLWPHPDIPVGDFIGRSVDRLLISTAIARLQTFAFVSLIENPQLAIDMQAWLGRPFTYDRVNETARLPPELSSPLDRELTPKAFALLNARSRLDRELWLHLARRCAALGDPETSAEQIFVRNVARHAPLMAS